MFCKHDWVGDEDCAYCRNEELEQQLAGKDREFLEMEGVYQTQAADLEAKNLWLKEQARVRGEITERLSTLAVKWVDAGHHDWPEIKELIRRLDGLIKEEA